MQDIRSEDSVTGHVSAGFIFSSTSFFVMIQNSFVLLPSVKQRSEAKIWKQGIHSWGDFLDSDEIKGMTSVRKASFDSILTDAKSHLRNENSSFFTKIMRAGDQWRLYDSFKDSAVYLDIETNGYYGGITVIGLSDGYDAKTFVRGFNLDRSLLLKELSKYKLIVTFNGGSFDLPMIKRYFGIDFRVPHVDLRFVCQKMGLVGGLKAIEKELGIKRRDEVVGISGQDAVYLWEMWKSTGNREYLEKLVMYNEEDILNLLPLAQKVIPELWTKVRQST